MAKNKERTGDICINISFLWIEPNFCTFQILLQILFKTHHRKSSLCTTHAFIIFHLAAVLKVKGSSLTAIKCARLLHTGMKFITQFYNEMFKTAKKFGVYSTLTSKRKSVILWSHLWSTWEQINFKIFN
jgi:hypothetical protein